MLNRTVVMVGCGGLCFHGMSRYVSWMGKERDHCITLWVDGDMLEMRNEERQWQPNGREGVESRKVNAVKRVIWGYGMDRLRGIGAISAFPLNIYVPSFLKRSNGKIVVGREGIEYGQFRASASYNAEGVIHEEDSINGEVEVAKWVTKRMMAEVVWVVALPDNHSARIMAWELGRDLVVGGARDVRVAAAGNWVKGGWSSVCRMGVNEKGEFVVAGDWTKYRPDIAEEARAEEEGRASGLACAAMGEQSVGSNGWTVQCLWGAIGAADRGWTGEYVWEYEEVTGGRSQIVMRVIKRD